MWAMVFAILVPGGQWVQVQDSPTGRDHLHMRLQSSAECADEALQRDIKLIDAGVIVQFKCVELSGQDQN
jgi:hypothetical protein